MDEALHRLLSRLVAIEVELGGEVYGVAIRRATQAVARTVMDVAEEHAVPARGGGTVVRFPLARRPPPEPSEEST